MKILEICEFSAGICGVWQRVKQESLELSKKGHDVYVFSSNIEKGTEKEVKLDEKINGIKIKRFRSNQDKIDKILTKNVTYFNFDKEFISLRSNIVITHTIHPHSFKALRLCKKYNIPCFLVTHAPFNVKRRFLLNLATSIYYNIKVKPILKNFTKIIAITKWEIPYILKLGVKKEKIVYIANGIPDEFFKEKIKKFQGKKILFLGRISQIKNIETLIKAFKKLNNKNLKLEIIGLVEKGYEKIRKLETENIKFLEPIYDLKKKIKKLQQADIFILPSKREAMPQSLIEAMALGKIVISSSTDGGKEIVKDNENGFLFEIGNEKKLKEKISDILDMNSSEISKVQKQARKLAEQFKWLNLIKKLEKIIYNEP